MDIVRINLAPILNDTHEWVDLSISGAGIGYVCAGAGANRSKRVGVGGGACAARAVGVSSTMISIFIGRPVVEAVTTMVSVAHQGNSRPSTTLPLYFARATKASPGR